MTDTIERSDLGGTVAINESLASREITDYLLEGKKVVGPALFAAFIFESVTAHAIEDSDIRIGEQKPSKQSLSESRLRTFIGKLGDLTIGKKGRIAC